MTEEEINGRITEIGKTLESLRAAWPALVAQLDERISEHTISLVNLNNEETRGRIKALKDLKDLPDALHAEREGLSAALSEMDAAN